MEQVRWWCSFCKKKSLQRIVIVSLGSYKETGVSICKLCGSTVDCLAQGKESEWYNANK